MKLFIFAAALFSFLSLGLRPGLAQATHPKKRSLATCVTVRSSHGIEPLLSTVTVSPAAIKPPLIWVKSSYTRSQSKEPSGPIPASEDAAVQLAGITIEAITTKLTEHFDAIAMGKKVNLTMHLDEGATAAMEEGFMVLVTVQYEARPIGGILRIHTDLLGKFSGVCSADRPLISNSWAESVDYIDIDELGALITGLVHQLGAQHEPKNSAAEESPQR